MQSETLAQEFARLVKEYHEGDDHTKPEAWNLLADFSVDNADAISDALSDKQAVEVKDEDAWLGLSTVSSEDLQEALDLLPSVLRPSMSNRIVAAITEQASIIDRFKRTSRARRLSFEAARSALVDVQAVEPVAWLVRDNDDEQFRLAFIEPDICWQKRPLYTSPPLSREGEDRAEVIEELLRHLDRMQSNAIRAGELAWHPNSPIAESIEKVRVLAATRSGSATGASGTSAIRQRGESEC